MQLGCCPNERADARDLPSPDRRGVGFLGAMDAKKQGKGSRARPVVLSEPEVVELTAEDERRAIQALAELLAPLFLDEPPRASNADG
jgi:hypothetical protein